MNEQNSLPENETVPTENAAQPKAHDSQHQPSKTSALPINDANDGETQQPNTAARQQETEEEETDRKQDEAISSLAQKTDWIEQQAKWIKYQVVSSIFLGAITLLVLVYHGYIMSRQSRAMIDQTEIMKGQLTAMNSDSANAERLIAANETLATQNKQMVEQAGEQTETLKQSVAAAEQSAKAAERGAQIAQESFFIGDRPYVTANAMLDEFKPGMVPTIDLLFVNAGKTPALDVQIGAMINIDTLPEPKVKKYRQMSEAEIIASQKDSLPYATFMPGGSKVFLAADAKLLAQIRAPHMTPALANDINNLRKFLFVWGVAIYKDGLRRPHKLRFCLFYDPKQDMFIACPTFNSTN